MGKTPLQSIDDVFAVQSRNGLLEMRLEATRMEHYDSDSLEYDYFPEGISVYSYTAEGLLESVIVSDKAVHKSPKKENKTSDEVWEAYGNVVLHNVINKETMETDTIYGDQTRKEIRLSENHPARGRIDRCLSIVPCISYPHFQKFPVDLLIDMTGHHPHPDLGILVDKAPSKRIAVKIMHQYDLPVLCASHHTFDFIVINPCAACF